MTGVPLLLASALLLLAQGCTVTAVNPGDDPRPRNSCSPGDDCGTGYTCSSGICQTVDGELESLLITASPPSDSLLPHFTYVKHVDDVPTGGGTKNLHLPGPAQVTGTVSLPLSTSCYPGFLLDDGGVMLAANDGTLPATVTFTLRQRSLGLSQQVYYAKTGAAVGRGYSFRVRVPVGLYDVYLAPPKRQFGTDCVAPPQLVRNHPVTDEVSNPAYNFKLPGISRLKLLLLWPQASPPLDGWLADIIEPSGGNVISTQVMLVAPTPREEKTLEYSVPLSYSTVVDGKEPEPDPSGQLLRLRPPTGLVAPTIYLDRSAIGLLQPSPDDEVRLTAFTRLPSTVSVHGQLLRRDGGSSVAGAVTLVSTEIYGVDSGVFASYQTTVQADANGLIDVDLPPGKYRVHGQPLLWSDAPLVGELLSVGEAVWDIPSDLPIQFGKVLELPPFAELGGHSRVPVPGAEVRAVPSPRSASPFDSVFGEAPLYPRASSGLLDDQGRFALQVDPGRFDLTVQAPEELGFAWYVRPGVNVTDRDLELSVEPRRPSELSGRATLALQSGTQPLASAAIRAYAYLNKDLAYTRDPEQAVSVVQVAETRANADGDFRLLIPDRVSWAPQ